MLGKPNYWDICAPKEMKINHINGLTKIQNDELGKALMDKNRGFQKGFDDARSNKPHSPTYNWTREEKNQYRKGYAISRHDYKIAESING